MTTLTSHQSTSPRNEATRAKQTAMLDGPVLPALLKLALPTVVVLGGQAGALGAALEYGHVIFSGAVFVRIVSLLAAALRGAGNTVVPAAVILLGVFVLLPLSPALIFGWGPFPRLGVMGAGLAVVVYYLVAAIVLIVYMRSARAALHLPLDATLIKWRLLRDILRVGG